MDFHSRKRKQLQALCKKYNIPANLTNLEMANNLASLFKEKGKLMIRGRSCMKGEPVSENDSNGVIRHLKKVRFNPENETIEFADSRVTRRTKTIAKPMVKKGELVIDSVDNIEASWRIGESQVRTTRTRGRKLVSGGVIEVVSPLADKKRKRTKGVISESAEGNDGERVGKTDLVSHLSDNLESESVDAEEIRMQARRSLRNRYVPISKNSDDVEKDCKVLEKNQTTLKKIVETNAEISMDTGLGGECRIVQPVKAVRRSKRNIRKIEEVQKDGGKVENESRKLLSWTVLEGGTRSETLEGNDRKSRSRISRNKSIAVSDGQDWNGNHFGKNEQHGSFREDRPHGWSSEKPLSKEVSVQTSAVKEVLENDLAEIEALVSICNIEVDEKNLLQVDTNRVNEDDLASHLRKKSTEFKCNKLVEPEEDLNVSIAAAATQAAIGVDGYLLVDLTDSMASRSTWKKMESVEEPPIPECIDSSCVAAHHGVDDDKALAVKEQNLLEHTDNDNEGEAIEPESVVDDHLAESNESALTSFVDLSDREKVRPTIVQDRDTDKAEKCVVVAEKQEPVGGILRTQNIEVQPLLVKAISPFEGLSAPYSGLSELEMADGTSGLTFCVSEMFSEDTDVRGKGSDRDCSLKKQHDLIKARAESADFNEISVLKMVNLEETNPAVNSVKLQCDSAEQEIQIPATDSMVVTEKENVVLVAEYDLLQGDKQQGGEYDLASQSQIKTGNFQNQDDITNVDVNGTTFRAVGFSSPLQAELEGTKHSAILTLSGHLETEKAVSGKYTQSGGVAKVDYAAEDVQILREFQEDCRFSQQSTQDRVCDGSSSGPNESESTGGDCKSTSKNAVDIGMPAPFHGERIASNMVVPSNNEADFFVRDGELVENISSSNVETSLSNEATDFQITSNYCSTGEQLTPVSSLECEGHANLLAAKEKSNYENQLHQGKMSASNTSETNMGDKFCCQAKIEALAEKETMPEWSFCLERASHAVDEETDYEFLEGNSFNEGHYLSSLNELNYQLTEENKIAGFETDSMDHYEKIEDASTSILTKERRILISVERDTDQTQDTFAPISTPDSSLLAKNRITSSSECIPSKDDNETRQEFKTLFATPATNTSPSEEVARHETEIGDARMQQGSTIFTVKFQRLNHGVPGNFVGLTEDKDETIAYEGNASSNTSKEVTCEGSDGSANVEFTGLDCSSYSAFDLFTSHDEHVGDKEDGPGCGGNALRDAGIVEAISLTLRAGIDPITSESETDQTEYSKEAGGRNESITKSHSLATDADCQCFEALGTSTKEISVSELRLSGDDEMQEEMRSGCNDVATVPVIQLTVVTEANHNDTCIKPSQEQTEMNQEPSLIKSKCQAAITAHTGGNPNEAFSLMDEMGCRYENCGLVYGAQYRLHALEASRIKTSDGALFQKHVRSAVESARQALSLSPNSAEFWTFYAQALLKLSSSDAKGLDDALRECERALSIENPLEHCRDASLSLKGMLWEERCESESSRMSERKKQAVLEEIVSAMVKMGKLRMYWNAMSEETKMGLIGPRIGDLREYYSSLCEDGSAKRVFSEGIGYSEKNKNWKFWPCYYCDEKFEHYEMRMKHIERKHEGVIGQNLQIKPYLFPEIDADGGGSEVYHNLQIVNGTIYIIKEQIVLTGDSSCPLDDRLLRVEVMPHRHHDGVENGSASPCSICDSVVLPVPPDIDAFGQWLFAGPPTSTAEELASWTHLQHQMKHEGTEAPKRFKDEFNRFQALRSRQSELMVQCRCLQAIQIICAQELGKREKGREHVHQSYKSLLKEGSMSTEKRSMLNTITGVLTQAENNRHYPLESNEFEDQEDASIRMTIHQKLKPLLSELCRNEARITRSSAVMWRLSVIYKQASLDYRSIMLPLMRNSIHAKLEALIYGGEEKQKTDAATEALLSLLALDTKKNTSQGSSHSQSEILL